MSSIDTNMMINMYEQGSLIKGENDMSTFTTKNKDYIITMTRESTTKSRWAGFQTYKYICTFSISNGIRELYKFNLSEIDVLVMLDNINELLTENLFSTVLTDKGRISDPNIAIGLFITKVYNNSYMSDPIYNLEIFDIYLAAKQSVKRLIIEFDEDSLEDFANLVYFTFLIDTEEGYLLKEKNYDEYHNTLYDKYLGVYVQ